MPDAIFDDPRLAATYDAFDGPRDDLAAYVAIAAELGASRVLDVGSGTGNLAALLVARGVEVVGVEPAGASLEIARRREPRATWVRGDAATLPAVAADLAVMTANVAQVFLTDDDWTTALAGVRGALRPGGHLVFETRRPERRLWEDWAADTAWHTLDVDGVGSVRRRMAVTEVRLPLVSFRFTYEFPDGGTLTSDSTLRFRDRDEVEASLVESGYRVLDVREAADRPGREFVFLTQLVAA
ncbi:class I SAM-dependent methyltransferase [Actinokineospora auranticolor]|uniref:Methyltransferase family protein n=1 Tax=Actinokineospora auranticolor TaxID=155976 RepID=A0A2S6H1Y8_9PSEU|nr:class I SAM-dependent methyltransferase [Actinokineospora auranticolor]PPK71440.1 methyltransferase family protein [Actinokineospora auranticolor]